MRSGLGMRRPCPERKKDNFPRDEMTMRHGPEGDVKVLKEKESTGTDLLFLFVFNVLFLIQRVLWVKNRR